MSEFRRNLLKMGGVIRGITHYFYGWQRQGGRNVGYPNEDYSLIHILISQSADAGPIYYTNPMYGFNPQRCWEEVQFVIKGLKDGDKVRISSIYIFDLGNGKHWVTGLTEYTKIKVISDNPGPVDVTIIPIKADKLIHDNYIPQ